jgi:hypothetical protein
MGEVGLRREQFCEAPGTVTEDQQRVADQIDLVFHQHVVNVG